MNTKKTPVAQAISISISAGNSKLGPAIPNTSLVPGRDCGNCEGCKLKCYAMKAWKQYPDTRNAWRRNSDAWRADPEAAADQVIAWLRAKRKPPRFFRIHVAGDFLNQAHVRAWNRVAIECPDTRFLAFTKMGNLLKFSRLAPNLQVIYSQWPGQPVTGPRGKRRAWCQDGTETRVPKNAIECPGNCEACGMCWNLADIGRDVVFHIH